MSLSLGLNLIVRNEEQALSECLKDIVDLFDCISVVDTGSSDKTIEILENEFSLNVLKFTLDENDPFNITPARNFGLDHNTAPWVFTLDADERISRNDLKKLINISEPMDEFGLFFKWVDHRYEIPFEDYKLFVLNNRKKIRFKGRIHMVPQSHIRELGGTAMWISDIAVHHFPEKRKREHRDHYNELLRTGIMLEPKWYRYRWFLGYSEFMNENMDQALEHFSVICSANTEEFPVETLNSYMVVVEILTRLGKGNSALDKLEQMKKYYAKVETDFEVRINHRIPDWIKEAEQHLGANLKVEAYRFAY